MEQIKSYMDLEIWKKTCDLAKVIYKQTEAFGKEEQFGLILNYEERLSLFHQTSRKVVAEIRQKIL